MKRYAIIATKRYHKDYKRLMKSGFDTRKLEAVIERLASDEDPPDRYRDHALCGSLKRVRECHVGPDWLLVYTKDHHTLMLLLLRTGTHREVFGVE